MSIVATIKKTVLGSYIPVIVVNSAITAKTAQDVRDCISRVDAQRAQALALLINSPGGSPVQCEIITNMVKGYTKKHHLPLYTFADDIAASGGQYLLSIGDKSYVQETSLVGSVGVVGFWTGLGELARDYKIKPEIFSSNKEQVVAYSNIFEDLNPEKKEKILKTMRIHHKIFIEHTEKYSKIKVPQEEREKKIYNAQIILGKDAVQYGIFTKLKCLQNLVDEIGSYQQVLKKDFPEADIQIFQQKSWKQRLFGGILEKCGINIEESTLGQKLLAL